MDKIKVDLSKELTQEHWKYIEDVLINHGIPDSELERIGFHYRTAMIHGYKHGYADAIKK